jgi:hypothetical protein
MISSLLNSLPGIIHIYLFSNLYFTHTLLVHPFCLFRCTQRRPNPCHSTDLSSNLLPCFYLVTCVTTWE